MDGRKVAIPFTIRPWACIAAALLLLPAAAWGQAMGKITVDGPSPLPPSVQVATAPSDITMKTAGAGGAAAAPAAPKTAAPALAGASAGATGPTPVAAGASPAAASVATPAPLPAVAPLATGAPTGLAPAPSASVPAAPETPPEAAAPIGGGGSELERSPIRGDRDTPGAGDEKSKSTVLPGLGGVGQVVAALVIVLGLILIGRALVKKFVPGAGVSGGKGVIEVLARHPLSKNQSLVLVRIGSQIVALNQGREASESVLVISEPMEVARIIGQIEGKNPQSMQAGFNKLLSNARMDLEGGADETDLKGEEDLDEQLEEMAAAKRQLMELRQHVRSVRDSLPRDG